MALFENMYMNGFFAGLVGSIVMSFAMILSGYFHFVHFSFTHTLGKYILGKKADDKYSRPVGTLLHMLIGASFGMVYVILADVAGFGTNIVSGIIFSLIPWLVMMLAFFPALGAGVFGRRFDRRLRDTMLVIHILYGLVLGLFVSL